MSNNRDPKDDVSLSQEIRAFLMISIGVIPAFTVATIAAYGFAVWASQVFLGPPGH